MSGRKARFCRHPGRPSVPVVLLVVLLGLPAVPWISGLHATPDPTAPAHHTVLRPATGGSNASLLPRVVRNINLADGASLPFTSDGYAATSLGRMLYDVSNGVVYVTVDQELLLYYNATTSQLEGSIPLENGVAPVPGAGRSAPVQDLALDAATGLLYAAHVGSDYVTVINTTRESSTGTIAVGGSVQSIAVDPGRALLLATDRLSNTLDVVSLETGRPVADVPVGAGPSAVTFDPAGSLAFVSDTTSDQLTAVNTSTLGVAWTAPVGVAPWGNVFDPAENKVFVANCGSDNISAVNATSGVPYPARTYNNSCPYNAALVPSTGEVWFTSPGRAWFGVINATNDSWVTQIAPPGGSQDALFDPASQQTWVDSGTWLLFYDASSHAYEGLEDAAPDPNQCQCFGDITYVPSNQQLYIPQWFSTDEVALNLSSPVGTRGIPLGYGPSAAPYGWGPTAAAYDPADGDLFISGQRSSPVTVLVVHAATDALVATINISGVTAGLNPPQGIAYDPIDRTVYVALLGAGLYAIDPGTMTVTGPVGQGDGAGIAVDPNNDFLFVTRGSSNAVDVVNAPSGSLVASVGVGASPTRAIYDPLDDAIWVQNSQSGNISVISGRNQSVVATIPVGGAEDQFAYASGFGAVLVPSASTPGKLIVINATTGAIEGNLSLPDDPTFVTYSKVTDEAYVASNTTITVIGPASSGPLVASFAPDGIITEVDRSFALNVTVAGGSGPLTYSYSGLPTGCTSANRSLLNCTPTAPGTYEVTLNVTDAANVSALGVDRVTVYPSLRIGAVTTHPTILPTGGNASIVANVTGGVGGYRYNWTGLPGGCLARDTSLVYCRPTTNGTVAVNLTVNDTEGANGTSGALVVDVFPPLLLRLGRTPLDLDIGMFLNISALATGGRGGYTFQWSGLPPGCSPGNFSRLSCQPNRLGNYTVHVTVVDARSTDIVSGTVSVHIATDPQIIRYLANRYALDLGENFSVGVSLVGGTLPYRFSWIGLPPGCTSNSTNVSCTPTVAGNYSVQVRVDDAVGFSLLSPGLSVQIFGPVSVGAPAANRAVVDAGVTVRFTVRYGGGDGPYSVVWSGLPVGCASQSVPTLNCTPATAGTSQIRVNVTDQLGGWALGPALTYTVTTDPIPDRPVATRLAADVGQSVVFGASVSGGSGGGYTFFWSGLPTGCAAANQSTIDCAPSAPGAFRVDYAVRDSGGANVTAPPLAFGVSPPPTIGPLTGSVASADVGQSVTFRVNATAGAGNLTYAWSGLPTGCAAGGPLASMVVCVPTASGSFRPQVSVIDGNGWMTGPVFLDFPVFPDLRIGPLATSRPSADVGQTFSISVPVLYGGAGNLTFNWTDLPTGCAPVANASFLCTPSGAGTFPIALEIVDGNGNLSSSTLPVPLVVSPDPTIALHAVPDVLFAGNETVLTASISGGLAPYALVWSGLPAACVVTNTTVLALPCTPAVGNYSVSVAVTDANDEPATSLAIAVQVLAVPTVPITIPPATTHPATFGELPLLVALAAVAAVIVAVALLLRRRRRSPPEPGTRPAAEEVEPAPESAPDGSSAAGEAV